MSTIKTIGVIGAGSMGSGIANVFAQNGYQIILRDIEESIVADGFQQISSFLENSIKRGKLTEEEKEDILNRIHITTSLKDFFKTDLVIETTMGEMELKQTLFKEVEEVVRDDVIITTNTSSMSITEIASVLDDPSRVAGLHFFNPPQLMKLIEVIRCYETSDTTISILRELCESIKKEAVEVKKDSPGFIVNRIMIPQFIEAIKVLEEGIASREDIDKAMRYGLNHPMGAFELQDYVGVDVSYHVMEYYQKEYADNKWEPPQLMEDMMRAGYYGKKSGKGFYNYTD